MSEGSNEEKEQVIATARAARDAASLLRLLTREQKDKALLAMADALDQRSGEITAANAGDVARAQAAGTSAALVDRLTLTPSRIADIAQALRHVPAG